MRRVAIIWIGAPDGTSANLFRELGRVASQRMDVRFAPNTFKKVSATRKLLQNLWDNVRRLPTIVWAEGIILHSYASLSFPSILAARLLRRKVVVVAWDVYPTTISGKRRQGRSRMLADYLESISLKLATKVVIPSEDFRPFVTHHRVTCIPLWPSTTPIGMNSRPVDGPVKIAFVGQIDASRGLPQAIQAIAAQRKYPIEFHIFASARTLDTDPSADLPNTTLTYYPHMSRDELQHSLRDMHFGLISLHPNLDQPGYPSKTFDYLTANLPIIYSGRELNHYCDTIEAFRVGRVHQHGSDLRLVHAELMRDWVANRDRFLQFTALNATKIAEMTD